MLRELGIGVTAYGVLSRGLLSGRWKPGAETPGDFRAISPRFRSGNVEANLALVDALRQVAARKGITAAQAAIAWVLAQGDDIMPLIGARRRNQLSESLAAANIVLNREDIAAIEQVVPKDAALGARYPEAAMAHLDSER
jgi:aryl-alcohol dehydrogenase-like predicted oxidoreductase